MEKDEKKENKNSNLLRFGKPVSFLLLEILAIISFSLGSSFAFFAILSALILILIIIVTFKEIKFDGISSFAFFLFPIFIFGLISILSYFKYDPYNVMYESPLAFLIPIGLTCFAATGYFINLTGSFKIRYALIVIYSGIALLTLINLFVTMIQFVPFYTLIYRDSYYYYNGSPSSSSVGNMAYFLMNFSMVEVSLTYFSYYPLILLTAFLPLGFISFKENKKLFVTYLAFGCLGILTLLLTINKMTLLILFGVAIIIGVIALYTKFKFNTKPLKIVGIVFGGLFVLGLLFIILNAQEGVAGPSLRIGWIRSLTTSNSFLNRLFNSNGIINAYNSILDGLFLRISNESGSIMAKLFGFPINGGYVDYFGAMTWRLTDSQSFFFDTFFTSGLFGVLLLTITIVVGIRMMFKYYVNSKDTQADKVMIMGFILVSLAVAFVRFDATPFIFDKTIIPFYMNNIFAIDLFLFGYCFFNSKKAKEKEEVVEIKEENNNEVQA